jgi:hypothetical protein
MNIFFLHLNQIKCARWHCDKHVVKMILETAQLLYTAHWYAAIDKGQLPSFATAPLNNSQRMRGYLPISNHKHPSALWARASIKHYRWLALFGLALCNEYRHRFNDKKHLCEAHLQWLYFNEPVLEDLGWKDPTQAMPDEYKSANSIVAYRKYYREAKKRLLTYTKRHAPHWISPDVNVKPVST